MLANTSDTMKESDSRLFDFPGKNLRNPFVLILAVLLLVWAACSPVGAGEMFLLEAEHFTDYGGWSHDSQFMDQMGSPYLLAHGLGVPVRDAVTKIELAPGRYRVRVRTKDWVAPWNAPGKPGRFRVSIDGTPLDTTFGTEGAQWHWQDGGTVTITKRGTTVALQDLTGFAGRCDAILFSTDPDFIPPNEPDELASFRRRLLDLLESPEPQGAFDLVVAGGGVAGICSAVSAARAGLSVALIQDRPVLGGNNSSEVRVWLQGARNIPPYENIGQVVAELEQQKNAHFGPANAAEIYEDDRKLAVVASEKNITLFLEHRVNEVVTDGKRIASVIAQHTRTGKRYRFDGTLFADCTGDACLGVLAGADHEMTVDGHLGRSNLWSVMETEEIVDFPECPWALDLSGKPFPGRGQSSVKHLGGWFWESGFYHDPIAQNELIRDWNFRAAYGAWHVLKNVDKVFPKHKLHWMAHVSGKRESRRLMGDLVLSMGDLLESRPHEDGVVPTGWRIDLHLPHPAYREGFEGNEFISSARYTSYPTPYWIPYRCLYSRNIDNLFMAGRNISVTHEALGATRVMRTGGCMGEVVGMAASLCIKHDCGPRTVSQKRWKELKQLLLKGVRPSHDLRAARSSRLEPTPNNLAREAVVTVSSNDPIRGSRPEFLNDGYLDLSNNWRRWISMKADSHEIEFRWNEPVTIDSMRVVSGYTTGRTDTAVKNFELYRRSLGRWVAVSGATVVENEDPDRTCRFPDVTSDAFRLVIAKAPGHVARIWEVEFYKNDTD